MARSIVSRDGSPGHAEIVSVAPENASVRRATPSNDVYMRTPSWSATPTATTCIPSSLMVKDGSVRSPGEAGGAPKEPGRWAATRACR